MDSSARFVVHLVYLRDGSTDQCFTDHRLDPGDHMDARNGRARVYSCFAVTSKLARVYYTRKGIETSTVEKP